jgi:hypothetical protein
MTNKFFVIINYLKVPKLKKILLHEIKYFYQITVASSLGGFGPQIPILSVLCPQLNLLNPNPKKFLDTPLLGTQNAESSRPHTRSVIPKSSVLEFY